MTAFKDVIPNTVGVTAKSLTLCERVRTVVLLVWLRSLLQLPGT